MPIENGQREALSVEYKNLIDFYFRKVKPIVTSAEREDPEQRMVITSVIEIRSAFDHLMRVEAVLKGTVDEKTIVEESHLPLGKYCEKNLSKAYGHLYRAAYDAYDVIAVALAEEIQITLKEDISQEALYTVIPNAVNEITTPYHSALDLVTEAKVKKDVDGKETEKIEFERYENAVGALLDIRDILEKNMPALINYDKELAEKERKREEEIRKTRRGNVIRFLIGVLIGLAGLSFGIYSKFHH